MLYFNDSLDRIFIKAENSKTALCFIWRSLNKKMQRTGRKLYTYGNLGEAGTEIWSDREIVYCK